jgi:hypothetical protein
MSSSSARNADRFGFGIETFGCGEDEFKLGFWILGKPWSDGREKLIICELVGENTAGCSHIAVVVGTGRYKCYLEWSCF